MPEPLPLPRSLQRSADRLASSLAARNRAVYRRSLAQHAAAFGAKPPRHVQSQVVREAIAARAQVSADSITRTHLAARRRFYDQTADVGQAKALYKEWVQDRAATVAHFEAGTAAGAASRDFRERNRDVLTGTAHVEPAETEQDDVCADLIAAGAISIADVQDDLPAHPHCTHAWTYDYDAVEGGAPLWVGGPDENTDEE